MSAVIREHDDLCEMEVMGMAYTEITDKRGRRLCRCRERYDQIARDKRDATGEYDGKEDDE